MLRENKRAAERPLKDFCAGQLQTFKVRDKVLFVNEIPKGATNNFQPIGLANKLALAG